MKNGNNDISSLEEQMANNDDICCSCGIVTAFPKAFFDNYRVAGVGFAEECIMFAENQCESATYYCESPWQKSEIFASPL